VGRILALDVGDRRIGIAVSDNSGVLATPRGCLVRHREGYRRDVAALAETIREVGANTVVVGIPERPDGTRSSQAEKIAAFAEELRKRTKAKIVLHNEAHSSFEAEERLRESGTLLHPKSGQIDAAAAAVILQSYLDRQAGERE
jgi:putative Holliday junction resolvase